ncbi:MAG TPA: type III pantothenate kinase [Longimicrobiales bacterium]|nr:type III pantothenate kinase [Longimicrobiales bacterium]
MNITFDIGNTETVIGLFENGQLLDHWRIATEADRTVDELGLLVRGLLRESGFQLELITAAAVGSVVPPVTPVIVEMCERHLGVHVLVIDARSPLPIRLDVDEPMTVGADRIVNTLAAAQLYKRDTIAVDLGTATTFDCISAEGVFLGGIIAPGVRTAAETLVRRTAKLPRVDLEKPAHVIGRRTETCLRSGIFYGAIDSIDGAVRRIKEEWGKPEALVVVTGGLATLIGPHCRSVERIEPFLTLYGLDLAYRYLEEREAGVQKRASVKKVK